MLIAPPERPNICSICHQKAYGYNYDVISCNACKMFFRRANTEKVDEKCKKGGRCFDGADLLTSRPKCRACRYKKCVDLGMRHHKSTDSDTTTTWSSTSPPSSSSYSDVSESPPITTVVPVQKPVVTQAHIDSRLLQQMLFLNTTRKEVYSVINVLEDPSFVDLVAQAPRLGIYKRPNEINWELTPRKLKPWGSLGVLLVAEVIKTLDVYNALLLSDRVTLLKNVAFKSHHLCIAYDSYLRKQGRVFAPTGGEMFPQVLFDMPGCKDIIMDLLTSPMQPLIDLQLSENEFLMLNMIVICNPALGGLSPHGQGVLSLQQRECTRILFQICMQNNPLKGHMRFASILALDYSLNRQRTVTNDVVEALQKHWTPKFFFSKVLTESHCKMEKKQIK